MTLQILTHFKIIFCSSVPSKSYHKVLESRNIYIYIYLNVCTNIHMQHWPFTNVHLNYVGSLIHGFFFNSKCYSTT